MIEKDEENKEGGSGGQGGQGGKIAYRYRDAMSLSPRDDALPPSEIKRMVAVHEDLHKAHVDKQKETRKERAAKKDNNVLQQSINRQGHGAGGAPRSSDYKQHPISQMAQFSGMDNKVVMIREKMEEVTNDKMRNELENRLENTLQNRLENRAEPKFNPRPRGPLG